MTAQTEEIKVKVTADARDVPKGMERAVAAVRTARKQIEAVTSKLPGRGADGIIGKDAWGAYERQRREVQAILERTKREYAKTQAQLDALRPKIFTRDSAAADDFIRTSLAAGWSDVQIDQALAQREAAAATTKAGQAYAAAQTRMQQYSTAIEQATGRLQGLNTQVELSRQAEVAAKRQALAAKEQARAARQAALEQTRAARQIAAEQARAARRQASQGRQALGALTGMRVFGSTGAMFAVGGVMALVSALGSLGSKLWETALQNETFKNSMAQVKGNLSVAFQSIYIAVLPALQSLASWLATVTNYLAQFTAALFGVSYSDAAAGAKKQADSINKIGGAAKKARRAMAGFDEINVLSFGSGGGGGGGSDIESKVGDALKLPKWLDDLIHDPKIQEAIDSIKGSWDSIVKNALIIWDAISPFAAWLGGLILDGIVQGFQSIASVFQIIAGIFEGDWNKVLDGLKNFALAHIPPWIKDLAERWGPDIVKWLTDAGIAVGGFFSDVGDAIVFGFTYTWGIIKGIGIAIGTFFTNWWNDFKAYWSSIGTWFASVFQAAWNGIKAAWSAAVTWFSGVWEGIKNTFIVVGTWFIGIFTTAWTGVKNAWSAVGTWFSGIWTSIKGAFSSVGTWFSTKFGEAWTNIKSAFSSVGTFFSGLWDTIKTKFTNIGTSIGDAVGGAFKSVVNGIFTTIERIVNGFIDKINSVIDVGKNFGLNINRVGKIYLPRLATGGIVTSPTLAWMGEQSKREAVLPLDQHTDWMDDLADRVFTRVMSATGSREIVIHNQMNLNGEVVYRDTVRRMEEEYRRTGLSPVPV